MCFNARRDAHCDAWRARSIARPFSRCTDTVCGASPGTSMTCNVARMALRAGRGAARLQDRDELGQLVDRAFDFVALEQGLDRERPRRERDDERTRPRRR